MARINWTEFEQSQVFTATCDLLKQRKVALPVEGFKGGKAFMQAIRDAQVGALPEKRRRPLSNIDAVSGELRQRFIINGVLPKDPETLKRGYKAGEQGGNEPDERAARIAELEQQVEQYRLTVQADAAHIASLAERIKELEARPDAMTVVRQYVSRMLADALIMADDAKKPAGMRFEQRKEQIPQFERERRATGGAVASEKVWKPVLVVVGGQDTDHQALHRELGELADLRYFNPDVADGKRMSGLKQTVGNGGKVILWLDHARHQNRAALQTLNVEHHIHNGNFASLLERCKGFISTMRAKREGGSDA